MSMIDSICSKLNLGDTPEVRKYRRGRMTAEQILDFYCSTILSRAGSFKWSIQNAWECVEDHNVQCDSMTARIERCANGTSECMDLDIQCLEFERNMKSWIYTNLRQRYMAVVIGTNAIALLEQCNRFIPNPLLSRESVIARCQAPELIKKVAKEWNLYHPKEQFPIPTKAELNTFYDAAKECYSLLDDDPGDLSVVRSTLFDEYGLLHLRNSEGQYVLAEENPLDHYRELDYKGLIPPFVYDDLAAARS